MKKRFGALLMTAIIAISFAGCSSSNDSASSVESSSSSTASVSSGSTSSTTFPKKPIQIICPVKAGGDTDYNTRVFAQYLSKYLDTDVVVTNVEGGATILGMQQVLDGAPDGLSLIHI